MKRNVWYWLGIITWFVLVFVCSCKINKVINNRQEVHIELYIDKDKNIKK